MTDEKIKNEEILSNEELDNVAGGTYAESASDALEFSKLGIKIYDSAFLGVPVLTHNEFEKLRSTFQDYGITIKDNGGLTNKNQYFIGGVEVSRDTAWSHVKSQFNK